MEEEELQNPELQSEDLELESSASEETSSENVDDTTSTEQAQENYLAEINKSTGKNFKSLEDVAKSLTEGEQKIRTQGQELANLKKQAVGGDDTVKEIGELRNRLNQAEFYKSNPQYDKPEIKKILGNDPAKSIEDEAIKNIVDKAVAYDKAEESKSILKSNPRLGKITDKIGEAKEAIKAGDSEKAKSLAAESVIDAFEL